MDERMRRAIEGMENRKLSMEDKMPFTCTRCGGCCVHQEELLVNPLDIFLMAKEMGLSMRQWMEKYAECYIGADSRFPIVRIQPVGNTRRCPLLKNNRCSIQQAKPSVCRLYPLGRSLQYSPGEDGKPDLGNAEVIYFHSGCICGSQIGTKTVREWLEESSLLENEAFFVEWSQTISEVIPFIRKMEKEMKQQETMYLIWNMILVLLYESYDTKKDFQSQFKENVRTLKQQIAKIEKMEVL